MTRSPFDDAVSAVVFAGRTFSATPVGSYAADDVEVFPYMETAYDWRTDTRFPLTTPQGVERFRAHLEAR